MDTWGQMSSRINKGWNGIVFRSQQGIHSASVWLLKMALYWGVDKARRASGLEARWNTSGWPSEEASGWENRLCSKERGKRGPAHLWRRDGTAGRERGWSTEKKPSDGRWLAFCTGPRPWVWVPKRSSVPSTHIGWLTMACNSTSRGIWYLWPPWAHVLLCTCHTQTCRHELKSYG